jgi:hypothetical protein
MANEMLQRPDLAAYVVAGLPKSYLTKLRKLVEAEKADAEVLQVDEELTEWLVAQLQAGKRRSHERTHASSALWRAYRALSAARYHLQDRPEEEQVRELRRLVEELWREISPEFAEDPDSEET